MIDFMPQVHLSDYFKLGKVENSNYFNNFQLTLRGRDSIAFAVKNIQLDKDDVVLLPGYLCDTVSAVFTGQCTLMYYDIDDAFSIDPSAIEDIFSKNKVKVFYVIHYFGFLHKNLDQIRQICDKYNVLLWEDHAHSALSTINFDNANAMFFSFRKVLPVPDGGGLWLRDKGIQGYIADSSMYSDLISLLIFSKRYLWKVSKRLRNMAHNAASKNVKKLSEGRKNITVRPVSRISRRLIGSADIDNIISVRRHLFDKWWSCITDTEFKPVFSSLPDAVCPQGFPIWIANANRVLERLEDESVFLKIHWPLSEYLKNRCPNAWRISKSIVTLPIYPGLSDADIGKVVALLCKYGKPC